MKLAAALIGLLGAAAAAAAPPDLPPIAVRRTSGPIQVDGDLSDPGWKDAAVIDQFWETQPGDNIPPKVQTRALVAYDSKYLYIGIDARDPEPAKIRAPTSTGTRSSERMTMSRFSWTRGTIGVPRSSCG